MRTILLALVIHCFISQLHPAIAQDIQQKTDRIVMRKSEKYPFLNRLYELDEKIQKRFPVKNSDPGLGQLGLILYEPDELAPGQYYDSSPRNAICFARTGGDGVHFSLLEVDGVISEKSPVIVTAPVGGENVVAADSLENFIRFGLINGYFRMENLCYVDDDVFTAYSSPDWKPKNEQQEYLKASQEELIVLKFIAEEWKTTPLIYKREEFDALQTQYLPMIKLR